MIYGKLRYNYAEQRYGIWTGDDWYIDGLHCGKCFNVYLRDKWIPTRIEFSDDWYLIGVGLKGYDLEGLDVEYADFYF